METGLLWIERFSFLFSIHLHLKFPAGSHGALYIFFAIPINLFEVYWGVLWGVKPQATVYIINEIGIFLRMFALSVRPYETAA